MAEAFVRTIKCDYVRVSPKSNEGIRQLPVPDAEVVQVYQPQIRTKLFGHPNLNEWLSALLLCRVLLLC